MEPSFSKHFATSSFIVLVFTTCTIFYSVSAARDLAPKTNTEFIRISCGATTYPNLCFTTLSSQASSIQTSPKLIFLKIRVITLSSAKSTSAMMLRLSHGRGMKPREVGTMRECVEELSDTVDQLQRSMSEMVNFKSSDYEMLISDVQTWVSAALTDESTCTDGFAGNGLNGNLKTVVRGKIVNN
ncbi:21 kDa protein-like [Argentina anserina]|uniref:21 kDa protein-like n=1 Tax=Argentina anserina TaxID=57926 RepID=UPI0021769103|nr:21 kDa protein-like [Potentilla anserina]